MHELTAVKTKAAKLAVRHNRTIWARAYIIGQDPDPARTSSVLMPWSET